MAVKELHFSVQPLSPRNGLFLEALRRRTAAVPIPERSLGVSNTNMLREGTVWRRNATLRKARNEVRGRFLYLIIHKAEGDSSEDTC